MKDIQTNVTAHAQADMAANPAMSHDTHPPHARDSGRPSSASLGWGLWREGLKDLQNVVLNPFPPGHVAQHEEPGTIANPTQLEVYQEKHNEAPQVDDMSYLKMLESASQAAPSQDRDRGRDR